MARMKQYKRTFQVAYLFWGHARLSGRAKADARGFCMSLQEAYANASRHLGRGSVYWRALIIDNEQGRVIARLTRYQGQIKIEEF